MAEVMLTQDMHLEDETIDENLEEVVVNSSDTETFTSPDEIPTPPLIQHHHHHHHEKRGRKKMHDNFGDDAEGKKRRKRDCFNKNLMSAADKIRQLSKMDLQRLEKRMSLAELAVPSVIEVMWTGTRKCKSFAMLEAKCYVTDERNTVTLNVPMRLEKEMQANTLYFYFGKKDDRKGTHRIYKYGNVFHSQNELATLASCMRRKSREELETLVTIKKLSQFPVSTCAEL
jgi:hypothetical protein